MLDFIMVLMVTLSNAAGDVFISRGMKEIGEVSLVSPMQVLRLAKKILTNTNFLFGVFFLTVAFVAFLTILSWADMSFVVPVTSVYYGFTILGAKFILKEEIDRMRWAGTLLVCIGVALVCIP